MGDFKWRHFEGEVILWAVRWYCKYGISYRDLEQMLEERVACWPKGMAGESSPA